MNCKSFQSHDDPAMRDFAHLPNRLYADDPWYIPVPAARLTWQFDRERNPFFQYGSSRQFVMYREGQAIARCAAARNPKMDRNGERVGALGFFESEDDPDAACAIISHALDWLRDQGVTRVYGPMNFSIWTGYRFRAGTSDFEPYLGDLYNKLYYADLFQSAGFHPAGLWRSAEIDVRANADAIRRKQEKLSRRLSSAQEAGYEITAYRGTSKKILGELQDLVMESYSEFLGFYPISEEEFRVIFSPLEHIIRPEQLLLARRGGELCGFLVQHWDWAHLLRGHRRGPGLLTALRLRYGPVPKRWIMPITGIRRSAMTDRSGLGSALVHEGLRQALNQGASHIIYSLMSEHNRSNSFWAGIPARCTTYRLFQIGL
jgi:hypothetical protein